MTLFTTILEKYRKISFSERDKGDRFERLMKAYLLTDPKYAYKFKKVWLWNEFPGKEDLGGNDTGIDLVALTNEGDYWAIQCKCFQEDSYIDKPAVDSFLSTSSRTFKGEDLKTHSFAHRLWISTTNKWGINAQEAIKNQNPPVSRINLFDLTEAPVDWKKLENGITGEVARTKKKSLFAHQEQALSNTYEHFKENNRGKLIMACGTGKTFTSLRIAENETNGKGLVLFLVPSIALLGQTLNEWSADANEPINAICICSDPEITKSRKQLEDIDTSSVTDLALPASTNVDTILHQFRALEFTANDGMTVVFSTYQSIEVIAKAQKVLAKELPKYAEFDLIICDEAHRTTGVSLSGQDESAFTKVHNNDFIQSKKRLYMTATPRLYDENTKSKAAQAEALLCSMDDVDLYGEEIYRIGFGEAVEKNLLTDYKVLILTLNENDVPPAVQKMIADGENEINTDDASKLIGCINALSKQVLGDEGIIKETDPEPMRRAVAFCQSINASKKITATYNSASETYISELPQEKQHQMQMVSSKHIDGSMSATERNDLLSWLKDEPEERECRILTNVRCLSEGVDVPSLDAVLFLSARNSQVDVVQSVGRVMRKAPNKKYGYIIIPIVVPADIDANIALDNNDRYKVVWTVLNALRAHDDRFNATVNKIELNKNKPNNILVGRPEITFDDNGNPVFGDDFDNGANAKNIAEQLALQFEQLQSVVFAKMVQKVGDRRYWEQWAKSVAEIAQRQTERITKLIDENPKHEKAFEGFMKGLHKNINPSTTKSEAIEMLSQHIITKPVFDALFEGYSFVQNNPMSQSMQKMLDLLEGEVVEKDTETLQKFYESVKVRASGIDNAEGKQKIIIELYDKFFKTAFPKMVEKLGIVYTPTEVVDFIIHSVDDVLKNEFGRGLSEENVHILDPFTGTGTFITRLLQSGVIKPEDLERKYKNEIHANEIVLLAYYIASINIENVFHDINGVQGLGYGEQSLKSQIKNYENANIQGTNRLAGSNEFGGDDLSNNKELSEGGNVWANEPNKESSDFNSSEHSRRLWEEEQRRISSISRDSKRLVDGTGNTHLDSSENKNSEFGGYGENISTNSNSGKIIDGTSEVPDAQTLNPIPYMPFEGICLTDTFQLGENEDSEKLFSEMFPQNSKRVQKQKKAPLRVIIGNPPYSIGQKSANDNAQNQSYPKLDADIAKTYAKLSSAGLNKSLYDAYIKAFRWSTDRLDKNGGIICFVSNGAWLDGNSTDGFRKSLEKEFSSIYVFNLRGNARTSGELRQKEGGGVFGLGSRTPISITLLVKNPDVKTDKATVYYHDIGDYLTREEKLKIINDFRTFDNPQLALKTLQPNEHGDWISMRNGNFENYIPLVPEKKFDTKTQSVFNLNGPGISSARDFWVFNFSKETLKKTVNQTIDFFNSQSSDFKKQKLINPKINADDFIDTDLKKISWTVNLKKDVEKGIEHTYFPHQTFVCNYRPFIKQLIYFEKSLIERPGISRNLFPVGNEKNLIISISGVGSSKPFSVLISDKYTTYDLLEKTQIFPLYYYEENKSAQKGLFDEGSDSEYIRRDAISDFILERAKKQYGIRSTGSGLSKEDIFYYVYGFLHSTAYRETFANDLKKMLPRLPLVEDVRDFWAFSKAGRKLAELHLNYENVEPCKEVVVLYNPLSISGALSQAGKEEMEYLNYKVDKMRFPKKGQKQSIIYNNQISIDNIPEKAYQYVVNGKSAIEWIMERYQVTTHKASGITNNPNDWALEVGNPRYILDLLLSIINVSVQTVDIVEGLPKVEFE